MIVLYRGCTGDNVRVIQESLGIENDGIFGPITEGFVKDFQKSKGLFPDGIVGPKTWVLLVAATTDNKEVNVDNGLNEIQIHKHYLPKGEYLDGPTKKEYLFLHHTAGWHNPYKCINNWGRDDRGRIATEFVIGGPSISNTDFQYDGEIVKCIPDGGYGWHLGKNGNQAMHTNSVGIEVCNFSYLKKNEGKYYCYAKYEVHPDQVVKLDKPFHNKTYWHRYSNKQLEALRDLIWHIADRDNIDVRDGLPKLIKEKGADAFAWNVDAYYGRVKGLWTHSNTNSGKSDMFPQQELLDMLMSL